MKTKRIFTTQLEQSSWVDKHLLKRQKTHSCVQIKPLLCKVVFKKCCLCLGRGHGPISITVHKVLFLRDNITLFGRFFHYSLAVKTRQKLN